MGELRDHARVAAILTGLIVGWLVRRLMAGRLVRCSFRIEPRIIRLGDRPLRILLRKSRIARNPRTGAAVPVPPRKVPIFKVSKELKDMVAQS